jgi:ribosomal protein L19
MATLIKKAEKAVREFKVGDTIKWSSYFHDGRSYETTYYSGTVTKVNRVNLIAEDKEGNTWKVEKEEVL